MKDGSIDLIEKAYLTPTGRKYRLEPEDDVAYATGGVLTTQDVVDECRAVRKERATAESAAPRPEDVPEGETWQVETPFTGGVGYRHARQANPWFVTYPGHPERIWHVWNDSEVTLIARLVPETTEQDDEQVFDPAFVYRDRDGDEWKLATKVGRWVCETRKGHTFHVEHDPPAEYGPYTRIEDTK